MTDQSKKRRVADIKAEEKQARLAKALRENLRRRKAQLKGQRDGAAEKALEGSTDEANSADDA